MRRSARRRSSSGVAGAGAGAARARSPRTPAPPDLALTRLTVVTPTELGDEPAAARWLDDVARDADATDAQVEAAVRLVNVALAAQRAAAQDPYVHELAPERAVALRIGYGTGDEVADGKWSDAREIPAPEGRRRRTDVLAPQQHVAAVLGGRDELLACENLVLRARLDLEQRRVREAALQLRVGLEALLRELADATGSGVREDVAALTERRDEIVAAANSALRGELDESETAVVRDAVARCERALRRRRAGY